MSRKKEFGVTHKYTVCVDFDGVLHAYTSPWVNAHTIPDPPVDGAIEWLWRMVQKFEVVIFSTRCKTIRGRWAMRRWLREHGGNLYHESMGYDGIEEVTFAKTKPAALIYLDDRAVRFTGPDSWPTADDVHKARPWNKGPVTNAAAFRAVSIDASRSHSSEGIEGAGADGNAEGKS